MESWVPPACPRCGQDAVSYHSDLVEGSWYVCRFGHKYGNAAEDLTIEGAKEQEEAG